MKNYLSFFALFSFALLIIFSSCKKEEEEDETGYVNTLSAKIGNASFSFSMPLSQMTMGMLQISGTNSAGNLQLMLNYDITEGTYFFDSDSDLYGLHWNSGELSYWPDSVVVVVSKHDVTTNIIEGTFGGRLDELSSGNKKNVENGIFKISYIEYTY